MGKRIAVAVFGIGILIAIAGAAKVPQPPLSWPDTGGVFFLGVTLSVFGLFVWRLANRRVLMEARQGSRAHTEDQSDAFVLLDRLNTAVEELEREFGSLSAEAACTQLERLNERFLLPFTQRRDDIVAKLGMRAGADILCTIAFSERMLNRAFSAASDRHLSEAAAAFPSAAAGFRHARATAFNARNPIPPQASQPNPTPPQDGA